MAAACRVCGPGSAAVRRTAAFFEIDAHGAENLAKDGDFWSRARTASASAKRERTAPISRRFLQEAPRCLGDVDVRRITAPDRNPSRVAVRRYVEH